MANSVGSQGGFLSGSQTVATAGTAVALLSSGDTIWHTVTIVAKDNNTGRIYVGGSDVDSAVNRGLQASDVLIIQPHLAHSIHLDSIFIDASVNGEGVDFYCAR